MAQGHYDRNSPAGSSDQQPVSGSTSPHVIKPARFPHKQRSSSMNSVTSNHTRSMSIISLESPRNSIVSIDDGFIRPTRNNSSTSLNSLGPHAPLRTPDEEISHPHLFPPIYNDNGKPENYVVRPKAPSRESSAIMSDEESDPEKSKSPRKSHSPHQLHHFKRDFQFRMSPAVNGPTSTTPSTTNGPTPSSNSSNGPSTTTGGPTPNSSSHTLPYSSRLVDKSLVLHDSKADATPSPLSLNLGLNPLFSAPISLPAKKPDSSWKLEDDMSSSSSSSSPSVIPSPAPKLKHARQNKKSSSNIPSKSPNLIQQSIYSKKKMIFSKELQLELLSSNPANHNNSIMNSCIETKFIDSKPSSSSPLSPTSSEGVKLSKEYDNQPVITTLKQQNKLIYQLNRKWNKSILEATSAISSSYSRLKNEKGKGPHLLSDKPAPEALNRHRKRSRRDSFDSDDDVDVLGPPIKDDSS